MGGILKDKIVDDDTKSETDSEVDLAVNAIAPLVSENPEERRNSFERLPSFKKARRFSQNYHAALGRRASVFSAAVSDPLFVVLHVCLFLLLNMLLCVFLCVCWAVVGTWCRTLETSGR